MKNIPLIDLSLPHAKLGPEIFSALQQMVDESDFIGGKRLKKFEAQFAAFTESKHAIGVANGTSALTLALKAAGVGPGHEVITVAHTFIATAEAIFDAGAAPIFVDVDAVSGLMTAEAVRKAITLKTKAVVPVHLYGHPVDLTTLSRLCKTERLMLIQDSAQSHGARWNGKPLSAFGEAQTYSFYPGKNLGAWGDAGAVTTNDDTTAERLRSLRDHGRRAGEKYLHQDIGGNHRMDPMQAAVLSVKLPLLEKGNERRRELFETYKYDLASLPEVSVISPLPGGTAVHHLLVIRTPSRDGVRDHLKENGIASGIHYPVPLNKQPAFAAFGSISLPQTEKLASEILSLPFYPELSQEQVKRVTDAVKDFFRARG